MTTQNPANRPRALIAMSGGVDSSVAACLMQQAGYDCTGITMRLTHNETLGQSGYQTCCSEKDIEDAAEVAFALDMPYPVLISPPTSGRRSLKNLSASTRRAAPPTPASTAINI